MSVALLWVISPSYEVANGIAFLEPVRDGNRFLDSSRFAARDKNIMCNGRLRKGKQQRWCSGYLNADLRYSCLDRAGLKNCGKSSVISCVVASPAGEMAMSSEQRVYDVVLKQAALVNRELKSQESWEVKPGIVLPGNLSLLSEAYDRCGEVCAEYAKTFFLGTLLMTPERQRAIWAIYVWCRRTDELVDGPNASHITPTALDRWEARLEDVFRGRPFDMLDAALADTVSKFPVDIQAMHFMHHHFLD